MNDVIDYSDRRLVVITDPHIKKDLTYFVYRNGISLDMNFKEDGSLTSIFVKNTSMDIFEG